MGAAVAGGTVESGVTVELLLGTAVGELAGVALGDACGSADGDAGTSRSVCGTIASTAGTASPIVPRAVSRIGEKFWVAVA